MLPHFCGKLILAKMPLETTQEHGAHRRFLFPEWADRAALLAVLSVVAIATAAAAAIGYYTTNTHLEVGYAPVQPVANSHKLHAGDLAIDCRYCHSTVERSSFASIPATQICMNCHGKVLADSPKLSALREAQGGHRSLRWVRVHNLPDYVYFDHAAHLSAGVGCSSCHGRVDAMVTMAQAEPLSMGWCLDCHRDAGRALREPDEITTMDWKPRDGAQASGAVAANGRRIDPPLHCSGCHR